MSRRPDDKIFAYDPFGEAIEAASPCPASESDTRLRNKALVLFWTVALVLIAGRVYFGDHSAKPAVVDVQVPAVAAQQVVAAR